MPARIRIALFVTATLALLAAAGVTLFGARGGDDGSVAFAGALRPDIPPQDFRLRDQDGKPVSLRSYRGRVVVLTFMYTTCRDTCPLTATQIRGALDDLKTPPPALAVSVDPVNDTPERARRVPLQARPGGRPHAVPARQPRAARSRSGRPTASARRGRRSTTARTCCSSTATAASASASPCSS